MFRIPSLAASAASCFLLVTLFGCGSQGPTMVPVSGNVTLDEKPLAEGTIYFKTPSASLVDAIPIKGGKYEGKAAEGERRVEITAYQTKVLGTGQMKGEVQESLVSTKYNTESKLTAKVSSPGPNTFDFAVKSK